MIGLWEPTYTEGYEIENGYNDEWNSECNYSNEYYDCTRIEFFSDGVVKNYEYYNNKWNLDDTGSYYVEDNIIYLKDSDGRVNGAAIIAELNSTRLVLESGHIKYGDYEFYEKIVYKKVN